MVPYKTEGRGWGLKTLAAIEKGQFVIEYVGELIDEAEYQRRIQKMNEQKEENYYFLTIDKDVMIDAGPKGNFFYSQTDFECFIVIFSFRKYGQIHESLLPTKL